MATKSQPEGKSVASGHPMTDSGNEKITREAHEGGQRESANTQREQNVDPNQLPPNQSAQRE